jgi:Flp pilus assembly protein TadD
MCRTITTASSLCLCLLIVVVTLVGMVGLSGEATADTGTCPAWAAKVVSIEGQVEAMPAGETQWRTAALNDKFCPDDQIRTLENSRAALQLSNETILRLDQNTLVKLSANKPESPSLLKIFTGRALFMTRFPHPLTIETPYVNASSGGTEYVIEVDKEHQTSTLTVIEGTMHLKNDQGTLTITDGQSSITRAGSEPASRVVVNAKDTLHWALYYPPVLNIRDLKLGATDSLPDSDWRAMVKKSISAYEAGDLKKAFTELSRAPANIDDSRFYAYRASLLLAVGRVEEAQADIEQSLKLAAHNGLALSLQSIIAVVQNHPDNALSLAQEATTATPESSGVRIALSYAWQANFNLAQALTAAQDATRLDPQSSLAWARTAELWLSQGYLTEALETAKHAESLNPHESRVQTILGFAYLTQIKIKQAQAAFEQAITLISSDPLPRLGLGLAKIRRGKLSEGRQDIEIAAALDPGNALIRSYLGKAYYEEKRDGKAAIQFNLAKELDPMDPTPYLYDAIRKQTINRPVEAMQDLQESIKLNDNRAVYRSRLLLDNDLSSRSVSQGRIAQDLGFGQLALADGWKSVNSDPANYSAHRFLADNYITLPNSEISRQSSLLVSQLLQPLNSNPVQPSLSDRSAITPGTGPANPSFNEYTQLFDRNQARLTASGIVGNHDSRGEELVATGLYNRYSLSIGQFRYRTDGYRDNADLDQKIYDALAQVSLTPNLSVQAEARINNTQNGDLGLRFDPDYYSRTLDVNTEIKAYRVGLHYAVTPASDLLLSTFYQRYDEKQDEPDPGSIINIRSIEKVSTIEGQYILHSQAFNLIAGAGYYGGPASLDNSVTLIDPILGSMTICLLSNCPADDHLHHANYYLYSLIKLPADFNLSLGGSYDSLSSEQPAMLSRDQFNPKLGLTWSPTAMTTLRLVGLRSLRRDLASNQTVEPTQVAGFQQFFEDPFGTDSKLYGIGVDQKFNSKMFGGLEFTKRDIHAPVYSLVNLTYTDQGESRKKGRAYLYWMLSNRVTLSAEFFHDKAIGGVIDTNAPQVRTDRLPLSISLHYPSGFFMKLKTTYIEQSGSFLDASYTEGEGHSKFWVTDVQLGYRLPNRIGIVTVGCDNIFDRQFRMHDIENFTMTNQFPQYQPDQFIYSKLTLNI